MTPDQLYGPGDPRGNPRGNGYGNGGTDGYTTEQRNGHGNGHSHEHRNGYNNGHSNENLDSDRREETRPATMPIAIIGMGCRFPGDTTSPEKLWRLCTEARSAWSEIPPDRYNQKAFFHPDGERKGTVRF